MLLKKSAEKMVRGACVMADPGQQTVMRLATVHDILVAWQAGEIGYRRALELTQIDTLDELYEAAHLSGVEIRMELTPDEQAMAKVVADLIRDQVKRSADGDKARN